MKIKIKLKSEELKAVSGMSFSTYWIWVRKVSGSLGRT